MQPRNPKKVARQEPWPGRGNGVPGCKYRPGEQVAFRLDVSGVLCGFDEQRNQWNRDETDDGEQEVATAASGCA
jgi:hypothetical protein